MSVTPHDLMQLAVELYRSKLPVRRHAAVSRAYYALYHASVRLLADLGIHVSKGPEGHKDVRTRLLGSGDDLLRDIGGRLAMYHNLRISADYRLLQEDVEEPNRVVDMVETTRDLLDALAECQHEPRRGEVLDAFKP